MLLSDLLNEEVVDMYINDIRKAKDFLIFNGPDQATLNHLQTLAGIEHELITLKENLPSISVDIQ